MDDEKIIPYRKKVRAAKTYVATLDKGKSLKDAGLSKKEDGVFADPVVKSIITQSLESKLRSLDITVERVLSEISVIAFTQDFTTFRPSDKLKALDMLAKYLRLWETGDITINNTQINENGLKTVKIEFIDDTKVKT